MADQASLIPVKLPEPSANGQGSFNPAVHDFLSSILDIFEQGSRGTFAPDHDAHYIPDSVIEKSFHSTHDVEHLIAATFDLRRNDMVAPPVSVKGLQERYPKVFTILLSINRGTYIRGFMERAGLEDSKLPFRARPSNFPDHQLDPFWPKFESNQWMFCAPEIHYNRSMDWRNPNLILPFQYVKLLDSGATATTYLIKINPSYNRLHNSARSPEGDDFYVLKSFTEDHRDDYLSENESHYSLRHHNNRNQADPGIVRYFGSFQHGSSFNIILEYADGGTLQDYYQKYPPPSTYEDIIAFLTALLDLLSALYTLHVTGFHIDNDHHG